MRILYVAGYRVKADNACRIVNSEIVSALQKNPGVEVRAIEGVLEGKKASLDWKRNPLFMLRRIQCWPAFTPNAVEECYRQIIQELERTHYDVMIAAHQPYDAVLAAIRAKKKYSKVQLMIYELDPINYELDKYRKTLARYLYFLRKLAEKKAYDACDVIFHMESNRKLFSQPKYDKYINKSVYLDFPLIHDKGLQEVQAKEYRGQTIKLIYAGKMMSHFRLPDYLLKVLVKLHERINIEVSFYSGGDCEDMISEYAARYQFIHQKGYVDKDTLDTIIEQSDCLINIGNKVSDMLPSKLLSYIEVGLPILHVQKQENDVCVGYLNRYQLAVVVKESDPVEVSVEKIEEFLRNNYGRRLGSSFITSEFSANIPETSARKIIESICLRGSHNE